jgi:hypothetical protein
MTSELVDMSTLYKKERAYIETIYQKVKNKFREL